ncbi:hypothetical protein OAK97_01665 [bacterium]|jgi:hypothetical protein|nr:hypothetical protein [bacterium]MDG1891349.1 hypothetical protein [Verrucomicrobiota bacterium]
MDITNKTKQTLSVSLPEGKKLFLGPGKTGQVTQKALKYPAVLKLLAAGDLETDDTTSKKKKSAIGNLSGPAREKHGGGGAMRQSGDR